LPYTPTGVDTAIISQNGATGYKDSGSAYVVQVIQIEVF
jgi:hypothetical protein